MFEKHDRQGMDNIPRIESHSSEQNSLEHGNKKIEMVNNIRYISVYLDNHLEHIHEIRRNALHTMRFARNSKSNRSLDVLHKMHRGYVEPHPS